MQRKKAFNRSGKGVKRTALHVFKLKTKPQEKLHIRSMADYRWLRDEAWFLRTKPRRRTVGYIRAFLGPHFFAGCYTGAEND
jgi:hypothetical protein